MTDQTRVNNLVQYVQGINGKENGKELYLKYKDDIEKVTPQEAFEIFHTLLQKGLMPGEILNFLDKVINVFYKSLKAYAWQRPDKNSFMDYLLQENNALVSRLELIKSIIKEKGVSGAREELHIKVNELKAFDHHYLKKENILFPYLEKKMKKFDGLSIMWALHDETRSRLKKVATCLEAGMDACGEAELNSEIGSLFFAMYGLVQKEELILFPAASEIIAEVEWKDMLKQSLDYEFPFISKPDSTSVGDGSKDKGSDENTQTSTHKYVSGEIPFIKSETGILEIEQALMIFNTLPVDLTFVDENNKVRFFTRPNDRIFPRSPAIIGRDVEKCHPPESVHVVTEIIEGFRTGKHESASFWINVKGRMILIQYYALRDSSGAYRGTLEVSQDITEIKGITGERRLLSWDMTQSSFASS